VKCIRREIGEIVRYLRDKKSATSQTVATAPIAPKICQGHSHINNVLTMFQISYKSVHFRRSYSRTPKTVFAL